MIINITAVTFFIIYLIITPEYKPVFGLIPTKIFITLLLSGLVLNLISSYYFDQRPEKIINFMVNRIIKKGKKMAVKPVSESPIKIIDSINYKKTTQIIGELHWLEKDPLVSEIYIILYSHGGIALASLAICQMIKACQKPINIISGDACSAATYILACGTKGKRSIAEGSMVMIHQSYFNSSIFYKLLMGKERQFTTDEILDRLLSENTGQPLSRIIKDTKKETYFSAKEAVEYGLADRVIEVRTNQLDK